MNYAIDIILGAVLLIFIIRGHRKGFIRMLLETVGYIASAIASWFVSAKYSPVLYDTYLKAGVIKNIQNKIGSSNALDTATAAFYSIPEKLRGIAEFLGMNVSNVLDGTEKEKLSSAEAIEKTVVGPIAVSILKILMFIAAMIICSIIIKSIIGIIGKATKLPVVKSADGLLGGLLGLVCGTIVVVLLAEVVFALSGMIDNEIISSSINYSYVISFVKKMSADILSKI